jgi:putative ABC transport system permease protein
MQDRLFRLLLRLLPEDVRGAYGREIEATFRAERRDVPRGSRLALAWLWVATAADLVRQAPAQQWDVFTRDVRYGVRLLARRRLHSLAAIATLALAIAANVAVFAVVDAVVLHPLPYGEPARVVMVEERAAAREPGNLGYLTFVDVRARSRSFAALAAAGLSFATLSGDGREPERAQAMRVSASYFDVVGAAPALGRRFREAEDRPGDARRVTILSDRLWRRRFNADPSVIGRPIHLNERSYVVVGVMPAAFDDLIASRLYDGAELWTPLGYDPTADFACRTCRHLAVFGRLGAAIDPAAAEAELGRLFRQLSAEHPNDYDHPSARVRRLSDVFLGPVRPVLLVVWAGVALLLVAACVNVANLLLMRASERGREVAIRAALGVTRGRLLRQLLTEACLLGGAGGLAALLPAWAAIRLVSVAGPPQLPRLADASLDLRAFAVAGALSLASAAVFGLVPLRQFRRYDASGGTHGGARRADAPGVWRLRATLAGGNVAVAAVLLVGASLLVRSLLGLLSVEPGFDPRRVLTARTDVVGARYAADRPADEIARTTAFYDEVLARLRGRPGVESASAVTTLPLGGGNDQFGLHVAGRLHANPEEAPSAHRFVVQDGFFDALRIPVLRGRALNDQDRQGAPLAAVINRQAAAALFPGEDPIGRQIMLGPPTAPARTIVGVVGDVRHEGLEAAPGLQVYVPQGQWAWAEGAMTLVVRGAGDAASLAGTVRRVIREVDAAQAVAGVETYETIVARSFATRRFAAGLLAAFAVTAGLLAVVGLYGAIGVMVGLRQREIGVRLALGAGAARVRRMVLGQGLRPAAVGLVAGLAAAWLAAASLRPLVVRLEPRDPATFAGAAILLVLSAVAACAGPAWRAARVDPVTTLRAE